MPRSSCKAALAHATPAGTLYILVGLRRCDRAAYQKVFDSLARPSDDVEVVRGCMVSKEPFRQVLSQIQDGRFDDYLSRPPTVIVNRWSSLSADAMTTLAQVSDQSATLCRPIRA